jgi:hypothetical protein
MQPTILTADHVKNTCKPGKGAHTCSYLAAGLDGFTCAKGTPTEAIIRQRQSTMKAQGDNCSGATGSVKIADVY